MRKLINYLIVILLFFTGCHRRQDIASNNVLNVAASLINTNPDSAYYALNTISTPDSLNNTDFAHWCLLSGKIADKIYTPLPSSFHMEKANRWLSKHGTTEEKTQSMLYLGRSYAEEGDKDRAMTTYTNALDISVKHKNHNLSGHINSYIAALYETKSMYSMAIEKYKLAANYFKSINKMDSYICALRDVGREYALMDSLSEAEKILIHADSLVRGLSKDNELKSSISNSLGNIYIQQKKYDKAIEFFKLAIHQYAKGIPNYVALTQTYIYSDSIVKACEHLKMIPTNNPEYTYSIKNLLYQINKAQKDYKQALENLEDYVFITDSLVYEETLSNTLIIEKKYNFLKTLKENEKLKSRQLIQALIIIACILLLIITFISYQLYKKKAKENSQEKQIMLDRAQIELLSISAELEKKKAALIEIQKENNEYTALESEVATLSANYQKLQRKMLVDSDIYKKLAQLANSKIPQTNRIIITEELWNSITHQIVFIYPNLYTKLYNICPNLSEQEWRYCCLYMLGFDNNQEAKLLNIVPDSVKTKHSRLRQKLNITLPPKSSLYEYLINNMT